MFIFLKACNILAAFLSGVMLLASLSPSNFGTNVLPLLAVCLTSILNAIIFSNLGDMKYDITAIKKRLGMSEETTQDEEQNQSDNTPSQKR